MSGRSSGQDGDFHAALQRPAKVPHRLGGRARLEDASGRHVRCHVHSATVPRRLPPDREPLTLFSLSFNSVDSWYSAICRCVHQPSGGLSRCSLILLNCWLSRNKFRFRHESVKFWIIERLIYRLLMSREVKNGFHFSDWLPLINQRFSRIWCRSYYWRASTSLRTSISRWWIHFRAHCCQ